MNEGLRLEFRLPSRLRGRPNPSGEQPAAPAAEPVPRIARLLALAWKWEGMVRRGEVKDYAEITRRHRLTRARVTQICSLALLAPALQEALLVSHRLTSNSVTTPERFLRRALTHVDWQAQGYALKSTRAPA